MADETNTTETPEAVQPQAEETVTEPQAEESGVPTPELPAVTAQEAKVVDEDGAEPMVVEPEVRVEQVDAQVMQPREGDSDKVNVHEVSVVTDRVITDPSSPLAVQVPAEGRGDASLPIHRLAEGTVESYFEKHASKPDSE